MLVTISIAILVGLIVGDILNFIVFEICRIIDEEETGKKKKLKTGVVKNYFNYVLLKLKERDKQFLTFYLLMDFVTVSLTLLIMLHYGIGKEAVAALVFCYCLITLTFIDARTQYLPDVITMPLIGLGLIQGYFNIFTSFKEAIIGAFAGYWSLWIINTTFRLIRKKDGMGQGDFKLLAALGAWTGYMYLPYIVFASSFLGIFVALGLAKFAKNELSAPSPFGPSLSIAGFIFLLWGKDILQWYNSLFYVQ